MPGVRYIDYAVIGEDSAGDRAVFGVCNQFHIFGLFFSEIVLVNGIKNNLNLQWKSFLMLFKVKGIKLFGF